QITSNRRGTRSRWATSLTGRIAGADRREGDAPTSLAFLPRVGHGLLLDRLHDRFLDLLVRLAVVDHGGHDAELDVHLLDRGAVGIDEHNAVAGLAHHVVTDVIGVVDQPAVQGDDDVTGPQPDHLRGAAVVDLQDLDAPARGPPDDHSQLPRLGVRLA